MTHKKTPQGVENSLTVSYVLDLFNFSLIPEILEICIFQDTKKMKNKGRPVYYRTFSNQVTKEGSSGVTSSSTTIDKSCPTSII